MRILAGVAVAAALLAGPMYAEPSRGQSAPAASAHAPYTLETPIHVLMEDPVTLAWLDKQFPGLSERMRDPEVGTVFAGVSIEGLSIDPDHGRALTSAVMAKLAVSLAQAQGTSPPAS